MTTNPGFDRVGNGQLRERERERARERGNGGRVDDCASLVLCFDSSDTIRREK